MENKDIAKSLALVVNAMSERSISFKAAINSLPPGVHKEYLRGQVDSNDWTLSAIQEIIGK